jgi:membrane associated rhomboid family serine protease
MKIQYNSPVILTYTLLSTLVTVVHLYTPVNILNYFTVFPEINLASPAWYFRLFSHVIGHADLNHLVGNFTFILLIGPILEEKYGSRDVFFMIVVTALITGLLQIIFFSTGLLGASGVVFMLILLSSFTNAQSGRIPLTFILIVVLFLGREILQSFAADSISQFAHIIGGILGGAFGFLMERGKTPNQTTRKPGEFI